MDPLEQLLRPLASMINRQVRAKTPARALCAELAGKVVAVRVRDTALAMYFLIGEDGVDLRLKAEDEPDVAITSSLLSLASLAAQGGETALRDGSIEEFLENLSLISYAKEIHSPQDYSLSDT